MLEETIGHQLHDRGSTTVTRPTDRFRRQTRDHFDVVTVSLERRHAVRLSEIGNRTVGLPHVERRPLSRLIWHRLEHRGLRAADTMIVAAPHDAEAILERHAMADDWRGALKVVETNIARKLIEAFEEQSNLLAKTGKTLVVVTTPILRRELASLVRQAAPDGLVLSFKELPETKRINVVAVIGGAS